MADFDTARAGSRAGLATVLDRLARLETRHRERTFEALRSALLGGDPHAWKQLVEKYSRFVYTVALRLLEGVSRRDEAAAAIYARVLERLAARDFRLVRDFGGRCRFTTYLYRMVQSERRDFFRARRAETARSIEEGPHELAAAPATLAPALRPDLVREAVRESVARMAPHERILLVCRFHDGLKLREIADLFGLRDSSAADRAVRAALARLDLLRELNRRHRFGQAEYATLERALQEQLFRADRAEERGGG